MVKVTLTAMRHKARVLVAGMAALWLYTLLRAQDKAPPVEQPPLIETPSDPKPSTPPTPPSRTSYKSMINNFRYKHRRGHIINECIKKRGPDWTTALEQAPAFPSPPIISTKKKFMYCPVGKVGSSFFTRYVLQATQPVMRSPFDIPIKDAGRDRCENLGQVSSLRRVNFIESAVKVVFGRNPFHRVFSAYIDKLYSPNPYYWRHWGEPALSMAGQKAKTACASGVTFRQFVSLVVDKLVTSDGHLKPVFTECRMCDVMYDVVGTLETAGTDLQAWSAAINVSTAFMKQEGYSVQAAMDAVKDSVESAFSWKREIKVCIDLDKMGMRIWRKLQIRGFIDSRISYPFKDGEIDAMSSQTFIAACRKAVESSKDKEQLRKQKTQAFVEAFSSLSVEKISDIAKVYSDDFISFDYDPEPANLFSTTERKLIVNTDFLNWRKDWQLNEV